MLLMTKTTFRNWKSKTLRITEDEESEIGLSQSDSQSDPDTTRESSLAPCGGSARLGFVITHSGALTVENLTSLSPAGLWARCLLFLSTCICVLIIVGCILPSYSLNVLGIVGVLVESGQAFIAARTEYSVFSTIQLLFDQARLTGGAGDYIGLGTLSVLLILSVLIVPVLQCFGVACSVVCSSD